MNAEPLSPLAIGTLAAAIGIIAAVTGLMHRVRSLESKIAGALLRLEAHANQKPKVEDPRPSTRDFRAELDSLRSTIAKIPAETAQQVTSALQKSRDLGGVAPMRTVQARPPADRYDEPAEPVDALARLLAIANEIVQQSSTTLDAFRANAGALVAHVAAWPSSADGVPLAFIVEYRGSHYAVPNVVKPTRLPKEWFNRSEFGVNDEIQRVVSLPRLRRHGDGYEVQEAGVFGR